MIVEDLKKKEAFDIQSAVDLAYAKSHLFKIGLRDYRPMAMKQLINENVVGVTPEGMYFLINRDSSASDLKYSDLSVSGVVSLYLFQK